MSAQDWVLGILTLLVLALLWGLRRVYRESDRHIAYWMTKVDDWQVMHRDLHAEVTSAANAPWSRYEVVLADWGPDFTGIDDTLHRWRWAVLDADRAYKAALGTPAEIGTEEVPFMLGNDEYVETALLTAYEWIEQQENPVVSVVVGEVTPWEEGDPIVGGLSRREMDRRG